MFGRSLMLLVPLAIGAGFVDDGSPRAGASPAASPGASPIASPVASPAASPGATLPVVIGIAVSVPPLVDTWPVYQNATIGLILRYPPGWHVVEDPERGGVRFYPPEVDVAGPSPLIAFSFAADAPYDPQASPPPGTTDPHPITVSGIVGRRYEDAAFAIPTQGFYVDLPYRGGTLFITATAGPGLNLVPILHAMLPSVVLQS